MGDRGDAACAAALINIRSRQWMCESADFGDRPVLFAEPKSAPVNSLAIASVCLLGLALGLRVVQRRNAWREADVQWPFYLRKPLVSPRQLLYQRLVSALPGHLVLSDVALCSVLAVKRGSDPGNWTRRIRHLRYDFVVCTHDATVLAAIELDDSARNARDAANVGPIKKQISTQAGLRLLHWKANALPDQAQIQAVFGVPLTLFFEDVASSANQSWWPSLSSARRRPPIF